MISKKILAAVKRIRPGRFSSYKEIARQAGNERAFRLVGRLMRENKDPAVPCHRVIKSNNDVGGYRGSLKRSWQKAGLLLKEGAVGVVPTDTIYGLCASALKKEAVERVYKIKKRKRDKPVIVLISSLDDLAIFGIKPKPWQERILKKAWPGKVSFILPCRSKKFSYLCRGKRSLAFRLPRARDILRILKVSGPLVAPSANPEGLPPAETIAEARRYFAKKVFYWGRGSRSSKPSTLVDLREKEVKLIRRGAGYRSLAGWLFNH